MQRFKTISWPHDIIEEMFTDKHGNIHKSAHYAVSESKIPFTVSPFSKVNEVNLELIGI